MSQFVCTQCGYPAFTASDHCDNPACLGNPTLSDVHRKRLIADAAAHEARKREEEERRAFKEQLRKSGFISL